MHARSHIHAPRNAGQRAADAVARGMGSWRFIIVQTVIVILWMGLNVTGLVYHWDVYPFILLNLLFSTQAAYAAPIIMMSQNRAAAVDRLRDDHEAIEVEEIIALTKEIHRLTMETHRLATTQDETLALLKSHIRDDRTASS